MSRFAAVVFTTVLSGFAVTGAVAQDSPSRQDALDAAKKSAEFMMNTVSYRGGFVEKYTEDLSERWGEVPARESMVWVQETGTVTVGNVMLKAYQATGDAVFLDYAKRVADALVLGQLPCGGWHYFIDFDPSGTEAWYHDVLSKAWGWEEFYHWSGNATFDDNTSRGAIDFLLSLYLVSEDPAYRGPLDKALQFVLDAQYPLGGWPQRYPLSYDSPFEGRPDYSSFYTFNDGVISGNIELMQRAYRTFGDERYHDAAMRGMYFTVLSQMGPPQAGWAQQYTMDLQPGQARSYEPASVAPSQTVQCINDLMTYYKMTGDRRFLGGIPAALDWLDAARLPEGHATNGQTHAQFVEVGTNKPLYAHRKGTDIDDGSYWVDSEPGNFPGHYGMQITLHLEPIREEYERVSALSSEEAHAEYVAARDAQPETPKVSPETVKGLIDGMNDRGGWVEDVEVVDYTDWKFKPRRHFQGYKVHTFAVNMRTLIGYIDQANP